MKTKETTISISDFKAKCLRILEELDPQGIIVTKRGRPLARVIPISSHNNESLIGSMREQITIKGDLFSTGVSWNAESRHTRPGRTSKRRS